MAETHAEYMARRKAELSGGNDVYGSGAVQTTAPSSTFQPAINPQPQGPVPEATSATSAPAYDPVAAARAAEEAQKTSIRSGLSSLIDQALGVYDTLYGNIRGAASGQNKAFEDRYDKESGALTDQFNVELPKIGKAWAGRGAYNSSFRQNAEGEATKGFERQIGGLGEELKANQGTVASTLAEQEAQLGTDKSLLELTRNRLGEVTDLNELNALQAEIQKKQLELQGQVQSTAPQAKQLGDRLPQLQTTLTNIVNGQAPAALKRAIASQIVANSGLPQDQADQLLAQVNTQIVG